MSEILNESLKKAAKGTALAFVGMFMFMLLEFITRILIARNATQSEYGTFSIGFVLLNFFVLLSCLGLQVGATRYIAYFRGREDYRKVRGILFSAVQLSFSASIVCCVLFLLFADYFALVFHVQESSVLKIFALAVPFSVIIEILASLFLGFDRVQEKVYFRDILVNVLKVVFIVSALILGYAFLELMYAYVLSTVIASLLFLVYALKKLPLLRGAGADPMQKELLLFSLPLLIQNALTILIFQIDTLMLGYFKTAGIVGLYNAAHPISQLIPLFLFSLVLIYVPLTARLYAQNLIDEMRRNYAILTKWINSATFPLFLVIFLFPEAVLNALFGSSYTQASVALVLRILALGMLFHVLTGPNAVTLIVLGKTKLNLIDNLVGALLNLALNLLLIPPLGMIGAAIPSAISLIVVNVLKSIQIFMMHEIHPFTANYVKPLVASGVLISLFYVLLKGFFDTTTMSIGLVIAFSCFFLIVQGMSILITKSIDQEDIMLLGELEKMAGINMDRIKGIVKKFM
ncbi:MAG: flippase [Methanophagales archaeon ANME-1-THS]|nr:MAG: flippase [Methanophagales archaeon ANME-1-THS]